MNIDDPQLYIWHVRKLHRDGVFMIARSMDELIPVILEAKAVGHEIISIDQYCPITITSNELYKALPAKELISIRLGQLGGTIHD